MPHLDTSNLPNARAARRTRLNRKRHNQQYTAHSQAAPYVGRGPTPAQVLAAQRDEERLEREEARMLAGWASVGTDHD